MRKRKFLALTLATPFVAACGAATQSAAPTVAPPAPVVVQPTPVPMANKLVVYGDTVLFADGTNPDVCTAKSRFKRGESVGFRMTAIYPLTGQVADTADLNVKLATGDAVPMRYRGDPPNPHPGMWTGKWVVPDSAPLGVMKFTVEAKDKEGHTGTYTPFDVAASMLTIVG